MQVYGKYNFLRGQRQYGKYYRTILYYINNMIIIVRHEPYLMDL